MLSLKSQCEKNKEIFLNGDETSWHAYPELRKVWSETGSDHVAVEITGNDKFRITVMATVTSDGDKLPLFFIGKGVKDSTIKNQLGVIPSPNVSFGNSNAYMTGELFLEYLTFLRSNFPKQEKIHLLIDNHPTHNTITVKAKATELNIEIHFVPRGYTDYCQPLDISVFGPLKEKCDSKLRRILSEGKKDLSMKDSVNILLEEWNAFPKYIIEMGWSRLFFPKTL